MDKALVTLLVVYIIFLAVATAGLGFAVSRGSDTCCCMSEEE